MLISTVPIIIMTIYTYNRYTYLINRQTTQVAESIVENAALSANSTLANIKRISELFNFDAGNQESIVNDLRKYTGSKSDYTTYDVFQSNNNLKFICQNLIYNSSYINGIFVFTPSGEVLGYGYGGNIDVRESYNPVKDIWYKKTLKLEGRTYIDGVSTKEFIINSNPSISFSSALYDVYSKEFLGVLFIDCTPTVFDLSTVNTLPDTALLSIGQGNQILYSNIDSLPKGFSYTNSFKFQQNLDWETLSLTAVFNTQGLYEEFNSTKQTLLLMSLICGFIFIIISIFLSTSLTKPIIYLSKKMSLRGEDNLIYNERYLNRTDEIGILYNEYQSMIDELKNYIKNELENKLITLDSQMKSLEAQINSHFLYNTLESINSIAEIEEIDTISTMSLALGDMFRYSIKTTSELVTIKDEIKHVNDYISIQQIRFDNRFRLELNLSEHLYHLKILKLILQPIVENALYHGLQYCNVGTYIRIDGYIHNNSIYLTVEDDGIGMTPERLLELNKSLLEKAKFTELGHRNKQSIGLKNIHTRIQLYYGEGYGMHIESKRGNGTAITLQVPLIP
jgi:two-component system sensor histidine kinase YesM